jgi:hypothetical protein
LKGRFDYASNSNYPVGCPTTQGDQGKQQFETQLRQQNKQIVEVPWKDAPDAAAPSASSAQLGHGLTGHSRQPAAPPADHAFCISKTYNDTIYVTGPIETKPPVNLSQWNMGFTQYLKQKYSYQERVVNCNLAALSNAQRLLNAHEEGARAANKKVVETGWKLAT